jgi:hypothetical protein
MGTKKKIFGTDRPETDLSPYDSKPKGRIKRAIKKLFKGKKGGKPCEQGGDCGGYA